MGWPEKAALRKLTCKLRQEEWEVTGHMRRTEERVPSRGNDLDEDAGQERWQGVGWGRWTGRRAFRGTLSGARPWRPGAIKSIPWKQGVSMMGGRAHQGLLVPSQTWFMPSDHRPLSDIRSFPEEQLPTKASVWTAKAQVTERYLLCRTKEEGDLMQKFLIFTGMSFLTAGQNHEGEKAGQGNGNPYQSVFNGSFSSSPCSRNSRYSSGPTLK